MDFSDIPKNAPQTYPILRETDFGEVSPSVHWAQLHTTRKKQEYPLRRIYDHELLLLLDGRLTARIHDREFSLSSGELLFIPAGVPHELRVHSEEALFLGVHFDYYDELEIAYDLDIIVDERSPRVEDFCAEAVMPGCSPWSASPVLPYSSEILADMQRLIREFGSKLPGTPAVCKGLMLQILTGLYRMQMDQAQALPPNAGERLSVVTSWLEEHYREPCSNQTLARLIHVHEDYMAKLFKQMYGMTPNKYLQFIRHRKAKDLLRHTDLTVEEIGRDVGYEDLHYFSRTFRKWEGVSPRGYRNADLFY
ncbi:hypothetical protein SY83_01725 [Paenibacillus swuensis]|uniref:HTH araC/xylS-type domain-containing protein n=1 Tax=Paenibacillus swuensis TaxID=1178515 RepID=A0A172TDZ9_9BACL|nr:AraC family transcriptional regulator [Paenibacillus swuensis]ANE45258.1 hypothetical protein SY83_01725 [Paenibacillus swuensis]